VEEHEFSCLFPAPVILPKKDLIFLDEYGNIVFVERNRLYVQVNR